jgi:aryl-alcohol dehydrogenase-like predicted oxidoreductase
MNPDTTTLPRREIGTSGIAASLFSLGSWHTYDRMDFGDATAMLREAVDRGVNLFDVGVYTGPGMPPAFTDVIFSAMVRAAGLRRDEWLLSSKLWLEAFDADGFRPQLENALFRVGVEHADLVIFGDLRRDDLELRDLVLDIAAVEGVPGPQIAQLKYSVSRRSIPDGAPFARLWEQGLTLQASDCLEGGVLAGKVNGDRQIGRDPGGIRKRIIDDVPAFTALAASLGVTPAQLGIAFTLTHPALTTTLFGASSVAQLRANLDAAALVDQVGAEELRRLVAPFWADRDAVDPEGP